MSAEWLIVDLLECIRSAIDSGDWKVDGACDPDAAITKAEEHLYSLGWRKDGITGQNWMPF